jgi:hypothetical protein
VRDEKAVHAGPGQSRWGGVAMADLIYVGITVVFFWLSWQLVKLCERL